MIMSDWEKTYSAGKHVNSWPWSDLISLYFRHRSLLESQELPARVLELGFGTGNNYPFWHSLQMEYFGIEFSSSAVAICLGKFPELQDRVQTGDFSFLESTPDKFDIICDRSSVTCGNSQQVLETIPKSYEALRKGGLYFGVDWFSKNHSDFESPCTYIDDNTRSDFVTGQFVDIGQIHFTDRVDMLKIFQDFEILELTEKIITSHFPDEGTHQFASWNIVARKPL